MSSAAGSARSEQLTSTARLLVVGEDSLARYRRPVQQVGAADDALERLREGAPIERVVTSAGHLTLALLEACRGSQLSVTVVPSSATAEGRKSDGAFKLGRLHASVPALYACGKRAADVLLAALGLLAFLPFALLIALLIRLDSPGPVFFRQPRVGRGEQLFDVLKFRTMQRDSEKLGVELLAQSRDEHWLDLEHDPRVTKVGRFLRMTSLDELPQLWNVLRGEMSIVGPRPLIPREHNNVGPYAVYRTQVRPGLTGLWQVMGRTTIGFTEMVRLDCLYVLARSWRLDLRLLLKTIPTVLSRRGAN